MKKNNYVTTTIEEFLKLPANNESNILTVPQKAMLELAQAKKEKSYDAEMANRTLKKYLINVRQAQTNAKIVETLLA